MLKQRIAKTGIALAFGLALAASITSPAQAADADLKLIVDGGVVASITHHDADDVFTVHDWFPDGHGVRGTLYMIEDGEMNRLDSVYNGKGTGEYTMLEYDIVKGVDYVMEICTVDGSQDNLPNDCVTRGITE